MQIGRQREAESIWGTYGYGAAVAAAIMVATQFLVVSLALSPQLLWCDLEADSAWILPDSFFQPF